MVIIKMGAVGSAVLAASSALAGVQVDFSHSNTGAPGGYQNTGNITLLFSVDSSGNAILDASCADPDPAAFVDEFDGAVGTVSNSALWGNSFTIVLSGSLLRIDNGGHGLAVQGGNAAAHRLVQRAVNADVSVPDGHVGDDVRQLCECHHLGRHIARCEWHLVSAFRCKRYRPCPAEGSFSISSASDTDAQGFVLVRVHF